MNLPHVSFHSPFCVIDATLFIHEIAQQDALVPMVVSTKSDDVEVSFWSVALLHEFAVHSKSNNYIVISF